MNETRRRKAMTLVELAAALAISAMLAAATLSVATTLARREATSRRDADAAFLDERLADLLERDLVQAEGYQPLAGGFALRSHGGLDAKTLETDHVPATVTYEVRTGDPQGLLVRRQESSLQPTVTELVAAGVKAIRLAPAGKQAAATPAELKGMPAAVAVTVEYLEAGRPSSQWTVRTRAIWE